MKKHGILHGSMFLRCHRRNKDGKEHRYYSDYSRVIVDLTLEGAGSRLSG